MNRKHRSRLRQVKKLSVQVKKLSPKENDLLIMTFDPNAHTPEEIDILFRSLANGLNREIIALPITMDLTVEKCKDLIAELQSIIKED